MIPDSVRSSALFSVLAAALLVSAGGCGRRNEYVPPPPPNVDVAKPVTREVADWLEFPGTTRATDTVELRARVGGYLQSIHFEDGADVKQGDLLFVIEPEPFQVALDAAKATLQKAQAAAKLAEAVLKRTEPLANRQAVSMEDLDLARANVATSAADVAAGEAAVAKAELDLSYTKIVAPLSGKIGRHLVDVGNLIQPQANILTTIASYDDIFVYFTVSENDVLELMARNGGQRQATGKLPDALLVALPGETDFRFRGTLDFTEVGIDSNTGTQLRRGRLPNADHRLVPGQFVQVRLPISDQAEKRLLIDERAVATDQRGNYVLVVGDQGQVGRKVERREVTLGKRIDGMRVVMSGVQPDEEVIVDGIQRARPGGEVTVDPPESASQEEVAAKTPAAAPSSAAVRVVNAPSEQPK